MDKTNDVGGRQPKRIEATQEVERDGVRTIRKSSLELSGDFNSKNNDLISAARLLIRLLDPYSAESLADMNCSELLAERERAVKHLANVDQEIHRKAYEEPDGFFHVGFSSKMDAKAKRSADSEAMSQAS